VQLNSHPSVTATDPLSLGGGREEEKVSQQSVNDSTPAKLETHQYQKSIERGLDSLVVNMYNPRAFSECQNIDVILVAEIRGDSSCFKYQ
jgi:hypothetical protein